MSCGFSEKHESTRHEGIVDYVTNCGNEFSCSTYSHLIFCPYCGGALAEEEEVTE